jgi:hypothetical protein
MNRLSNHADSFGEAISARLKGRLEDHFRTDLSSIRIRTDAAAHAMNVGAGSLALAVGEDIFFRSEVYDPDRVAGQFIVAHEVSHVLQKRRYAELGDRAPSRKISSNRDLEMEADRSALAFVRGEGACALSPDHPHIARAFGPVGHYYTVFYLAMAAGFDLSVAADLAFYAQLPDELIELDAKDVCLKWLPTYLAILASPVGVNGVLSWLNRYGKGDVLEAMIWPEDFVATIQRGLHCLTGASSQTETEYRAQRLITGNVGTPQFYGLAMHAFADSFAHRTIGDPSIMYNIVFGHVATYARPSDVRILWDKARNFGSWATWVDNIANRPDQYTAYGNQLFKILRQKSGKGLRLPDPAVDHDLKTFAAIPDEIKQQNMIMDKITRFADNKKVAFYSPNDCQKPKRDNSSWLASTDFGGRPKPSYADILYHAESWSRWTPLSDRLTLLFADALQSAGNIPSPMGVLSRNGKAAAAALQYNVTQFLMRGTGR